MSGKLSVWLFSRLLQGNTHPKSSKENDMREKHVFIAVVGGLALFLMMAQAFQSRATDTEDGCASCHSDLSAVVPEDHFEITIAEVAYCLPCHASEGPATAFDWTIHFIHYAQDTFPGDCWSCHQLNDEAFSLIFRINESEGVNNGELFSSSETGLSEVTVESMGMYFQSWATSEHLDRAHARQGVTCDSCHATFFPEKAASMKRCLSCHGSYQHIATLTESLERNPHASHVGEIQCDFCHKAHDDPVDYCAECHDPEGNVISSEG
jgi:hypothetical protein